MRETDAIAQAATAIAAKTPKLAKLKKACQDLEAVFVKDLLSVMRKSVPKSQFGDTPGADIYDDMFNQSIADAASKTGSFGVGKMLYRQMAPKVWRERENSKTPQRLDIRG